MMSSIKELVTFPNMSGSHAISERKKKKKNKSKTVSKSSLVSAVNHKKQTPILEHAEHILISSKKISNEIYHQNDYFCKF